MQKACVDAETHPEFCQTSKMELVKLVVAAIFAKYLILKFGRVLNMLEFVKIGLKFRISLNTLGFTIYLNEPEYARVTNTFQ